MRTLTKLALSATLVLCSCAPERAAPPQPTARAASASQVRMPGESYRDALRRYVGAVLGGAKLGVSEHDSDYDPESAYGQAVPIDAIDASRAPLATDAQLDSAFHLVRDPRFLRHPDDPDFLRRISWLFPDDGCYARAALMVHHLSDAGLPTPAKAFIFGNLAVKTPNAPGGVVYWWYHVVSVYRTSGAGADSLRVLDPAVDSSRPLSLRDWAADQTDDLSQISVAICDSRTYVPEDSCTAPESGADASATDDEYQFLSSEWDRQLELGRDPTLVLGDHPPWI